MAASRWQSAEDLKRGRDFIDRVRKKNGGLTKTHLERLRREDPEVLEVINNLSSQLSSSAQLLAEQLYTKPTRFIYELIQNAEDNHYEESAEPPFLAFTLEADQLIVDSNEDGFTEGDIKAICAIHKSTKASRSGYIGEKGIGFKSVFNVAQKVHVQSGPYSFSFEYRKSDKGNNGLGMITPFNEDANELPENTRTRTILHLLEDCDHEGLLQELLDLPDTLLLFLTKLRRLTLRLKTPGLGQIQIQYHIPPGAGASKITQIVKETTGSNNSKSTKRFYVQRRHVSNMPADPARENIHEAEVVLGFPLDESSMPIIEDQHVFAYLPMKRAGYTFLIQSDFITRANREDIADSPWNQRLIREVAATFCSAVIDLNGFLSCSRLNHSWIRFLPTSHVADEVWGRVRTIILAMMRERLAFYTADESLRLPSSLRIVGAQFRDDRRRTLLPDCLGAPDAYISELYDDNEELPALRQLGVEDLDASSFLERLEHDLNKPSMSSMRLEGSNSQWQTRLANVLLDLSQEHGVLEKLRRMPIIPLDTGRWVAPLNASIFFPTCGGVQVPSGILSLVDKRALENPSRTRLFKQLGIVECSPNSVFPLIEQRYKKGGSLNNKILEEDITFLFFHNAELPPNYPIYLTTTSQGTSYSYSRMPKTAWTYCVRSEHRYAAYKLFEKGVPDALVGKIHYPRRKHYDVLEACGIRNSQSGMTWLRSLGIKETPQLRCWKPNNSGADISEELRYITEQLPQHLLGVLEADWANYHKTEEWDRFFKKVEVPVLPPVSKCRLESTYLPLPKLKEIVASVGLEESVPFLQELDVQDVDKPRWKFLERFGVGIEEDARFWLDLLQGAWWPERADGTVVFRIYSHLQRYSGATDTQMIQAAFDDDDLVLLPPGNAQSDYSWTSLTEVLWNGPVWYKHKTCLRSFEAYRPLQALFTVTLALEEASIPHFLDYLSEISLEGGRSADLETITSLYDELGKASGEGKKSSPEAVLLRMEHDKLVFDPISKIWYPPSVCIWASTEVQLPGKISLATAYRKQRQLFIDVLKIPRPTVDMHIAALLERAGTQPDKAAIYQEMRAICAFSPPSSLLHDKLANCQCFPVRRPSGEIHWMASTGDFAIADRKEYATIFGDQIDVLNLSLDEVHAVHALISALGVESRFMSYSVKEETNAQDGRPFDNLTVDLRHKALAIVRFAVHHGSSSAVAAFPKLKALEVFTSDQISRTVSITQNRRKVSVSVPTAHFHIAETEDRFTLYVPAHEGRRYVCLSRHLPIRILESLGVPNPIVGKELGSIITASDLAVIDEILDEDGIIGIPELCDLEERPQTSSLTGRIGERPARLDYSMGRVNLVTHSRSLSVDSHVVSDSDTYDSRESNVMVHPTAVQHGQSPHARVIPTREPFIRDVDSSQPPAEPIPAVTPEVPGLYRDLLDAVVKQAASLGGLPIAGHHLTCSDNARPVVDISMAVCSPEPGDSLRKIGAAGELFVFELLKSLDLPNFGREQWQSTIRHKACAHEHYRDMHQWTGSETADIVYHDSRYILTEFLTENGYLFSKSGQPPVFVPPSVADALGSFQRSPPKYYIEVKTTPGPLNTPFFCSEGQVQRIEDMKFKDALPREIYLIARVFGLGTSSMGVKLYVDPATLREYGKLNFKGGKYTVTPG